MTQADRSSREFDIVLFGATGFTGGLTATRLARDAPPGCRWALAGRDQRRLEAVRDRIARDDPTLAELPVIVADGGDLGSMVALAERTNVLITTVGPYLQLGDATVAACALSGTDYVDLTGEAEFVDRTWLRYHGSAERSGARLIHACGFDSIPHDLGALFTVEQLPDDVPLAVHAYVRADGRFSGGTAASALGFLARIPQGIRTARERRALETPPDREVSIGRGPWREQGDWALPFPGVDPKIVARSAAALPQYGPSFTYSHSMVVGPLPLAIGAVAGVGALTVLAQVPQVRRFVAGRVPPGTGPSEAQRAKSHFEVRFHGSGGGCSVICRVAGGDPGYTETSMMLAQSALCLAYDDLPETAGQVTTAVAMGEALTARVIAHGLTFEVVEVST